MNELYVQKLIKLINVGIITVDYIKDFSYKEEIQTRLATV
jgi:hypothetical protein